MELMSVEDLAEYLGTTRRTIYKYIQTGECPKYIRITAKNIVFDKKDVDEWLLAKKVDPDKMKKKGGEKK
ncbi:helix-turn-helix domain-containing protein [bacterium]|nr:helix-turn-helix domain-containing protein [bacterium]